MGALSRSPSPMTIVPRIFRRLSSSRIDSTATWSEYFRLPYPIVRAAAMAAFSVTRRKPISRLDSMSLPLSLIWRATIAEKEDAVGDAGGDCTSMRRVRRAILIALLLLYGAILIRYTCYTAGGSDSSGYLNAARLIAKRQLLVRVTPLDVMPLDNSWRGVFVPLGFS